MVWHNNMCQAINSSTWNIPDCSNICREWYHMLCCSIVDKFSQIYIINVDLRILACIGASYSHAVGAHWWAESPNPATSTTSTTASLTLATDKVKETLWCWWLISGHRDECVHVDPPSPVCRLQLIASPLLDLEIGTGDVCCLAAALVGGSVARLNEFLTDFLAIACVYA